jgi:hypothetical protein
MHQYDLKKHIAAIAVLANDWSEVILLVVWVVVGEYKAQILASAFLLVFLLLAPIDVIVTSPLRNSHGNEASFELLEARYGLNVRHREGTYSMGCSVPPNPVQWVLFIDFWPYVDKLFEKHDLL